MLLPSRSSVKTWPSKPGRNRIHWENISSWDGRQPVSHCAPIVGVVADVKPDPLDRDPAPTAYVPFAQQPQAASAIVVRTTGDPLTLAGPVSKQLRDVDADQPPYDMRSLEQVVSDNLSGIQSSANMMLIFAVCALTLAAAGIFAVMAYSVTQRTHEIGVRVALGARHSDVLRLVVGGALKMATIGLSIGFVLALLLTRALSSALFGVVQIDIVTFACSRPCWPWSQRWRPTSQHVGR